MLERANTISVRSFVLLWAPVVAYMALIFYLSGLSDPPIVTADTDKPWHTVGYIGLGIVIARAVAGGLGVRVRLTQLALAVAIAVVYGVSDELHQSFVPGRSADIQDLYADATGAVIGAALCYAWGIISLRSADV